MADLQGRVVDLIVTYAGGALSLEGVRFPYDRSWGRGRLYADTGTSGARELRDVDVFIEVHDRSVPLRAGTLPPDSSSGKPEPPVVIRERETPKPPPVVIRPNEPPTPPVVRPAPPAADRPPRGVEIVLLAGSMRVRGQSPAAGAVVIRMTEGESRELTVKAGW